MTMIGWYLVFDWTTIGQKKWARSRDTLERAHLRNGVSWLPIKTQRTENC
jgi:hypothetical protein